MRSWRHLALGTAIATCVAAVASAADAPVNLVVITIDTLRVDHVGTYGHNRETTPSIDALARRGTRFELAHATSPWTVPSTASILTSLLPRGHGSGRAGRIKRRGNPPRQIRQDVATLAEVLSRAGYRTAFFSSNAFIRGGVLRGFDIADNKVPDATQIRLRAGSWLEQHSDAPFFLYLQPFDLHVPIEPPERYAGMFEAPLGGERSDRHKEWYFTRVTDLEDEVFRRFVEHKLALYDGALRYVDDQIGTLIATLSSMGIADRTLVVVTSDHGEEFWDHAEIERRLDAEVRDTWGYGHGHSFFQELLHVPLLIAGPGIAARRSVRCPISLVDLAPTLLDLLGVPAAETMRGTSRAGLVRAGNEPAPCARTPVFAESPAFGVNAHSVLVEGRYKLIERLDGVVLLYDLSTDPGETNNLAEREPELAATLLDVLHRRGSAERMGREMELDEETLEKLRALGYID